MTALAANLEVATRDGLLVDAKILAAEITWEGAPIFIRDSDGYAYSPDGTTNVLAVGDIYIGICEETVDNSAGASGDKSCRVRTRGMVRMPIAGTLSQAKTGDAVFVNDTSDDSTLTLTPDPTHLQVRAGTFCLYDASSSYGFVMLDGYTFKKVGFGQELDMPSLEGYKNVKVIKYNYSFANDAGAVGSIVLGAVPSGAIILGGVIDITTTLTSGGSATIALTLEAAGDLKSATAVASYAAGRLALNANTTLAASSVKTTAARNLLATIAVADLTAGVFDVYLLVANA